MRARESAGRTFCGRASSPLVPVLFLDLFDFFFAQPEVVPDLVDEGFADGDHEVVLVFRGALERPLKEQNAVGQRVAVLPPSLGQRRSLVEAKERIRRLDLHLPEEVARRLVLDADDEVAHRLAKPPGDAGERVSDERVEGASFHAKASLSSSCFWRPRSSFRRAASFLVASREGSRLTDSRSSRTGSRQRTTRSRALDGRLGVRAGSACPMFSSSARAVARRTTAARRR